MSDAPFPTPPMNDAVATLLAGVAAVDRLDAGQASARADRFHDRSGTGLTDRDVAALDVTMRRLVGSVADGIRDHAGRLLAARGEAALAKRVAVLPDPYERVVTAGLFRDAALFDELLARHRLDMLAADIPALLQDQSDRPSIVARLAQSSDRIVAAGAVAYLSAQGRRHPADPAGNAAIDLAPDQYRRVAWWVAAGLRDDIEADSDTDVTALDTALSDTVRRGLSSPDEPARLEVAAMRLAEAIEAGPDELPALLEETLGDGQLALFVALIAHAADLDGERVRSAVIAPADARLWIVLRALDLERSVIAGIGYALAQADPMRDLDAFADALDIVMAVSPARARGACAAMALDPEYRDALIALAGDAR